MKIRNGFVSNSSSSSFIIAVKKGLLQKELIASVKELISDFKEQMESDIPEMFGEDEHCYLDKQGGETVVLWDAIEEDLVLMLNKIAKDGNNLKLGGYSLDMGTVSTEDYYNDIYDIISQFSVDGFNYKSDNIAIHFGDG